MDPSVLVLRSVVRRRAAADAELLAAARGVLVEVRQRVLAHRRLVGTELSRTQERTIGAEVRSLAAAELEVAGGFGVTEARALVKAASAPADLAHVVDGALLRGEVSWPLVRAFYTSTVAMQDDQRLLAGVALMGRDARLATADRLDPDGALHGRPWGHQGFAAALDAEVKACGSADPAAERAARARAYERRHVSVRVHDDGTATLRITGPAVGIVAAGQRLDRAARLLRRAGDGRNLDQLRTDVAEALLDYGTIEAAAHSDGHACVPTTPRPSSLGDSPGDTAHRPDDTRDQACDAAASTFDDLIAPADMEQIVRILHGLPPVNLQVVVPFSALSGGFPICARCSQRTDEEHGPPGDAPPHDRPADVGRGAESRGTLAAVQESLDGADPPSAEPGRGRRVHDGRGHGEKGRDGRRRVGRGRVAQVLGPNPFFITDGHARELALLPGTTLHRLVVDPLDGRLVERSISAYRPDADMRRQVVAADVFSRAPGARVGAHAGELDHVTPYGWAGGPTSELNLALLARRPHRFKTVGTWQLDIGVRRDLTVTTLLGQVVPSRMHDYRTYLRTGASADVDTRRDRANRLVYAGLAEHPANRYQRRGSDSCISVTHTDDTGQERPGPSPTHPTLLDLLGLPGDDGSVEPVSEP